MNAFSKPIEAEFFCILVIFKTIPSNGSFGIKRKIKIV